jgi:hypothetical protein
VTPIFWGLGAFLCVLALVWLSWHRTRRSSSYRWQRQGADSTRDFDAEWIYGNRGEQKAGARPREREEKATREGEGIIADAERRAQGILAEADRVRREVEAELAAERVQLAMKSKRLSEFLANTLEEVQRTSANGSATTSDHNLEELEAMRDELRDSE